MLSYAGGRLLISSCKLTQRCTLQSTVGKQIYMQAGYILQKARHNTTLLLNNQCISIIKLAFYTEYCT